MCQSFKVKKHVALKSTCVTTIVTLWTMNATEALFFVESKWKQKHHDCLRSTKRKKQNIGAETSRVK